LYEITTKCDKKTIKLAKFKSELECDCSYPSVADVTTKNILTFIFKALDEL